MYSRPEEKINGRENKCRSCDRRKSVHIKRIRKAKEKEIYDLKHDLIAEQIQSENDKKEIKRLDTENRELLLNKARLESSLEESLLGKIEEDASDEDETEQKDTTD